MGKNIAVIGAQWGDEGKGKIVDYLGGDSQIAVRFNGGNNAGHTVEDDSGSRRKVHLLPSPAFREGMAVALGNGMVIDLDALRREILAVTEVNPGLRVMVDQRAHVLTREHRERDAWEEDKRGDSKIGTTRSGNGPAYSDKAARTGIRVCDVAHQHDFLEGIVGDVSTHLNDAMDRGESVIFAGAHGTLLDIDHGTYPHVTSSSCTASGIGTGAGVDTRRLDEVVGVVKAYSTRIGTGPFPAEMEPVKGGQIREYGREYGTTTGRPRRIGWLDGVALRHAVRLNQFDYLAVTLLDVLSCVNRLLICDSYTTRRGETHGRFPAEAGFSASPNYTYLSGWYGKDLSLCKKWIDLPREARTYINYIEELTGVRVGLVSVGSRRGQTIDLRGDWR